MFKTYDIVTVAIVLFLTAFALSAFDFSQSSFGWHDQQRVYQLIVLSVACLAILTISLQPLPHLAAPILLIIFVIGIISSLNSAWPIWAFKEWARYLSLTLLAVLIGTLARNINLQRLIVWLLAVTASFLAFQFLLFYAMAFITGIEMLNADLLYNGFSNPRFFGQFQILLMPLLAGLALHQWRFGERYPKILTTILFIALATHWCIAITLGGRGLWLGLFVAHFALLAAAPKYLRLLLVQLGAAVLGLLIFLLLFKLIPSWLDIAPILRDSLRTSLSSRETIWLLAWEMAVTHPWLGVGPMHFSAVINSVAAHPHQVILQWLAEWGFVATSLAIALGAWGVFHGLLYLRRESSEPLDAALWLSIVGALILAQVDGVFVMPYTETWLAILIGIALARWTRTHTTNLWQKSIFSLLSIPALIILVNVLIKDVPTLRQDSEAFMENHSTGYTPRFWMQGWIPMQTDE